MSVYLHVGYPKTATTWFKKRFLPNVQNIRSFEREFIRQCFHNPGAFDFNVEDVKSKFETDSLNDIWISAELLTDRSWTGGVTGFVTKSIADRLKLIFPDATIIFFIRNQIDILASFYLQYIKSGGNYSIRKFLYPEKYYTGGAERLLLSPHFFLYDKIIGYYSQLFGKKKVHIFLYEEFAENPKKFIDSFASKFDLKFDNSKLDFSNVNMGYRSFLLYTRRICNTFSRNGPLNKFYLFHIPKFNNWNRYLHQVANHYRIFGKRPDSISIIKKRNADYFREFYAESNSRLIKEYGLEKIIEYNYPV